MPSALGRLVTGVLVAVLGSASESRASGFADGPKLVGVGTVGAASQGISVALSSDGSTALVGGASDDSTAGAAWVFVRSGGVWAQQQKLLGDGAIGSAARGYSVALSCDGNTAAVGGYADSANAGAVWFFYRSNGIWSRQDPNYKLVGTGASGAAQQGTSVALSCDGSTALVGGPFDSSSTGAAWVFTRSTNVWTQQGGKLVGSGASGASQQGVSVALSADGNTALVGGPGDNGGVGAAWVFTRSAGTWSPQGGKLVGTVAAGSSSQGRAVALSGDGDTALVGGYHDNVNAGAVWPFVRSGNTWSQQGAKLVGSGANGAAYQGASVALSGDGSTALVGGWGDSTDAGAFWVFTRSLGTWGQSGGKRTGPGASGPSAFQGVSLALTPDAKGAIVGGVGDDSGMGAAWIFTRLCAFGGDVNDSGTLDVADVFYLINYLFAGGPAPVCQ